MKVSNTPIWLLFAALISSACTTSVLEIDQKAIQPIPAKLVAEMKKRSMALPAPTLIRIFKQESELEIWKQDKSGRYALLKTYPMCRWSGQLGPKKSEGDRQAPEGFYHVNQGMLNPASDYYLSFNLGFPNAFDRSYGRTGTALMVHGACTSSGCFAVTNEGVAEIYAMLREAFKGGQKDVQVQSFPFRMTPDNMAIHRANPNIEFWQNLEEGADYFEVTRQPPKVGVCGKQYVFNAQFPENAAISASDACPLLTRDINLTAAKDRIHSEHERQTAALSEKSGAASIMTYADGGMHSSFQTILRRYDAETLQKRTSSPNAPVSRPKEALIEPVKLPAGGNFSALEIECKKDAADAGTCKLQ